MPSLRRASDAAIGAGSSFVESSRCHRSDGRCSVRRSRVEQLTEYAQYKPINCIVVLRRPLAPSTAGLSRARGEVQFLLVHTT